jgi:hypothetical protein
MKYAYGPVPAPRLGRSAFWVSAAAPFPDRRSGLLLPTPDTGGDDND